MAQADTSVTGPAAPTRRRRLTFAAAVLLVLVAAPIWLVEMLFLRPLPRQAMTYTPAHLDMPDFVPVTLRPVEPNGADLALNGWYIPGTRSETIVLCHGRGDTRIGLLPVAQIVHGLGYSTLVTEFRGHGDSGGEWSTLGAAEERDLLAALDWLDTQGPRPMAAFGYSMGGGVALSVAAKDERIRGVVTEGAVPSVPDLVRYHYGPLATALLRTTTPWIRWRTGSSPWDARAVAVVDQIAPRPVLIIHSRADRVVPFAAGEALFAAAAEPKSFWALDDVPHVAGVMHERHEYTARLRAFFQSVFAGS